jgi:hypothetical protein
MKSEKRSPTLSVLYRYPDKASIAEREQMNDKNAVSFCLSRMGIPFRKMSLNPRIADSICGVIVIVGLTAEHQPGAFFAPSAMPL